MPSCMTIGGYTSVHYERAKPAKKREERSMWINIFDPASSPELKSQLEARLRKHVEDVVLQDRKKGECQNPIFEGARRDDAKILPSGTTTAFVMTAGYQYIGVYSDLNKISKSKEFVFIGFSSGLHTQDKKFKDGTSMCGKVFITEEDLQTIQKDVSAPMLLLDETILTGATFAVIGNALKRQLGHTGEIYQAFGRQCLERWNGVIGPAMSDFGKRDIPICTELRTELTPQNIRTRQLLRNS